VGQLPSERNFGGNRPSSLAIEVPEQALQQEPIPMLKPFTILCLGVALSVASASAQVSPSSQSNLPSSTPVAYVYVAGSPGNGAPSVIVGYSASANGALTPIPGSPFQENAGSMAVNGKYLMAVNNSNPPFRAPRFALASLKVLHRTLMSLGGLFAGKRAEVAPPASFRILFSRVQTVFAGL
jgi:hypothetical protein